MVWLDQMAYCSWLLVGKEKVEVASRGSVPAPASGGDMALSAYLTRGAGTAPLLLSTSKSRAPFRIPASLGHCHARLGFSDASLSFRDARLGFSDASLGRYDARLGYYDTRLGHYDASLGFSDASLDFRDARLGICDTRSTFKQLAFRTLVRIEANRNQFMASEASERASFRQCW